MWSAEVCELECRRDAALAIADWTSRQEQGIPTFAHHEITVIGNVTDASANLGVEQLPWLSANFWVRDGDSCWFRRSDESFCKATTADNQPTLVFASSAALPRQDKAGQI